MSRTLLQETVGHLRRLVEPPATADDAELLRRFTRSRDESAFAELVQRHGPLVLGTARRILGEHHAAEDVLQATFLLLARKAWRVRWRRSIAPWLHAAAFRLACEARRRQARQPLSLPNPPAPRFDAAPERPLLWDEARAAIDEELNRLSAPLRAPLVLCYLQGLTRDEAAARLGWSLATLKRRLDRARDLLRARLTRRGLALTAALAALTEERLPAAMVESTASVALNSPAPAAVAALLSESGLARRFAPILLMLTAAISGLTFALQPETPAQPPAKRGVNEAPQPPRHNAPLPAGAVARLGSTVLSPGLLVKAVEFAPDGKRMAVHAFRWGATGRHKLLIADCATGQELRSVTVPGEILHIKWLKDGRGLAVLKLTKKDFYLWEWTDPNAQPPQRDKFEPTNFWTDPHTIAISADGRWLAMDRNGTFEAGPLELCEVVPNTPLDKLKSRELGRGTGRISAKFSPDSRYLYVVRREWERDAQNKVMGAGPGGTNSLARSAHLSVYDVASGKSLSEMDVAPPLMGTAGVDALRIAVSPDGKSLYLGDDRGEIHAYDWASKQQTMTIAAYPAVGLKTFDVPGVRALSISANGQTLYSIGPSHGITAWGLTSGVPYRKDFNWSTRAELIVPSPDGQRLAASGGGTVSHLTLLNSKTGADLLPRAGHSAPIHSVAFAADDKVMTTGLDQTVRWWDLKSGQEIRQLSLDGAPSWGIPRLTGEGRGVFFNKGDDIYYLDFSSGEKKKVTEEKVKPLAYILAVSGSTVMHINNGDKVRLWDATTGQEHPLTRQGATVGWRHGASPASISPDARRFVALETSFIHSGNFGYYDGSKIEFYDATSGELLRRWQTKEFQPDRAAWSPDGRLVLVGGIPMSHRADGNDANDLLPISAKSGLLLFDGRSGEPLRGIELAGRHQFGPYNHTTQAYDPGGPQHVTALAFTPVGAFFAVAQWGGAVTVHETATGRACRTYRGHTNEVNALVFTRDGGRLISGSSDMTGLVWDTSLAVLAKPRELKSDADRERAWVDLASPEWEFAGTALAGLANRPGELLKLVRSHLPAADKPDVDPAAIAKLVGQLDDPLFAVRERASAALARSGREALPLLHEHLAKATAAEGRKSLRALIRAISAEPVPSERLRQTRALLALEQIGSREAKAELKRLAAGHTEAALTRDAAAALRR